MKTFAELTTDLASTPRLANGAVNWAILLQILMSLLALLFPVGPPVPPAGGTLTAEQQSELAQYHQLTANIASIRAKVG